MSYKFIDEDENTFRIQHPDGSEFRVAKSAIGPEVHKRIKSLEPLKMADGGEVPDSSEVPAFEQISEDAKPAQDTTQAFNSLDIQPVTEAEARNPAAVTTPDANAGQNVPQGTAPQQAVTPESLAQQANTQQQQALQSQENANQSIFGAQSGAASQISNVWDKLGKQIADVEAQSKPQEDKLARENADLSKAIQDQKIDPHRLWSNMSVGNKILAAISVAFSGAGAGLTGQRNAALDIIQKSIDRDIEAQHAELGKKQTLLSENYRRLGDMRAAKAATKAQLLSVAQSQAQSIAARSGSQEAMARLQLANSQVELQKAQLNREASIRGMAAQGGNTDPSVYVRYMVPEPHQKAVFDEISRAQDTRNMGSSILKSFDEAAKENTVLKTGAGLLRTPPGVLALHQSMQPTFKDLEGTVRQAAMDNTFKNITPQPGDLPSTIKTKRAALEDYLKSKMAAPTAKGFGIDLDKFQSTTTDRPQVQTMGGKQYRKVPGGWVPVNG